MRYAEELGKDAHLVIFKLKCFKGIITLFVKVWFDWEEKVIHKEQIQPKFTKENRKGI